MIEITMPRLSDTMEEGAIASWQVNVGDQVAPGDVLAEIETDKAVMDFESYDAGTVTKLLVEPGSVVSIGQPIAVLDNGGPGLIADAGDLEPHPEPTQPAKASAKAPTKAAVKASTQAADAAAPVSAQAPVAAVGEAPSASGITAPTSQRPAKSNPTVQMAGEADSGGRRAASPLVRRLAREHEVDLRKVVGSGPGGRIIRVDVERAIAERAARDGGHGEDSRLAVQTAGQGWEARQTTEAAASAGLVASPGSDPREPTEVPLSALRRVIARRLVAAAQEIPAFTVTVAAQADELNRLRGQLNEHLARVGRGRVSVNDLVIKAAALALRQHPEVNASWGEDRLWHHQRVNLGVAVAAPKGLMVPVVLDADTKTPAQIGAEVRALAALANEGKLSPEQMSGGTFTVSNLGMYGVEEFTAIINPPEAAILAVGAARPELDLVDGEVVLRQVMRLTLTADHRLVDGALAAQFLATTRSLLENPLSLVA